MRGRSQAWKECGELAEAEATVASLTCGGRFGKARGVSQKFLQVPEVAVLCVEGSGVLGSPLGSGGVCRSCGCQESKCGVSGGCQSHRGGKTQVAMAVRGGESSRCTGEEMTWWQAELVDLAPSGWPGAASKWPRGRGVSMGGRRR